MARKNKLQNHSKRYHKNMENLLFEEFYLLFSTNFYQINFFFFEKKTMKNQLYIIKLLIDLNLHTNENTNNR